MDLTKVAALKFAIETNMPTWMPVASATVRVEG